MNGWLKRWRRTLRLPRFLAHAPVYPNVDCDELVRVTRLLFEDFPELTEKLTELLADQEDHPQVYTAMTLLVRALIADEHRGDASRFPRLFDSVEQILNSQGADVRDLMITGFLEDLGNLGEQSGINPVEWERWLGSSSLVGWRAVDDVWKGRISGRRYESIVRR
jgi:hypothetical protein